jgi:hypothetical protein
LDLPPQDHPAPLELVIPATENAYLVVSFELEPSSDPDKYAPRLKVTSTSSV